MTRRIVLVNWRRPDLTLRAARSVLGQIAPGDRLVVVDNGSGDDSVEQLRAAGLDVLARAGNDGFGAAVNDGARDMTEDALVLLNNDAVARPGFLDAIVRPLTAPDGAVAASTATILLSGRWRRAGDEDGAALSDARGNSWVRAGEGQSGTELVNSTGNVVDRSGNGMDRDWLVPAEQVDAPAEVFGLCGGACAIAGWAWRSTGGFRDDFFMYYEDTELSWRIRESGWSTVYAADAVVVHDHAASSGADSPMFVRCNVRNRLLTAAMHGSAGMAARAYARTLARLIRGPRRRDVGIGLAQALARTPRALAARHARHRGHTT